MRIKQLGVTHPYTYPITFKSKKVPLEQFVVDLSSVPSEFHKRYRPSYKRMNPADPRETYGFGLMSQAEISAAKRFSFTSFVNETGGVCNSSLHPTSRKANRY